MIPTVIVFSTLLIISLLVERHIIKTDSGRYRARLIELESSVDAKCREYADHLIATNDRIMETVNHQEEIIMKTIDKLEEQNKLIASMEKGSERQNAIFRSSQAKMRAIADIVNTVGFNDQVVNQEQ